MLIVITDPKEESALLFGLKAAELASVSISALALLVSLSALAYTLSARTKIRLRVHVLLDGKDVKGRVLEVYNIGRRKAAVVSVGGATKDERFLPPPGKIEQDDLPDHYQTPCVVDPGEVKTFHFPYDAAAEPIIKKNGFLVYTLGGRRPWRDHGLKKHHLKFS